MKRNTIKILLIIVLLFLANHSLAWANVTGTNTATFLKIGVGAKPIGMGEAYCALADGAASAYWNPAGLSNLQYSELISMHGDGLDDTSFKYFGIVTPNDHWGSFGFSYRIFDYGFIPGYNASGSRETDVVTYDSAIALSWGKQFNSNMSLGLNLKFINQNLDGITAATLTTDWGLLYKINDNYNFGLTAQNIGGEIKFIQTGYALPQTITLGIAGKNAPLKNINFDVDVVSPNDRDYYLNIGAEYQFTETLALRVGSQDSKIQGGLGVNNKYFDIDYAYVPHDYLGSSHTLSFSVKFGINKEDEIDKYYKKGKILYREGKYVDALVEFNNVLKIEPLHNSSIEYTERIVKQMYHEKLIDKVKSQKKQREDAEKLLDQAVIEVNKKDYNRAAQLVEKSLMLHPNNPNAIKLKERLDKLLNLKKE